MPRWRWILRQMTRRLWLRASLIGALGILAAVLAIIAENYVPISLPGSISSDAINSLLTIVASSMLSVTTFSLSVMVSAYSSATSNVTPRATRLLIEDSVTQNVLSTFIGSFLFGIVGIVVLKTGAYGDRGRIILFAVTIGVIALIVISLLHWIDHLTRLGRVGETTDRVEDTTRDALKERAKFPFLGGTPLNDAERGRPVGAVPITTDRIGYVQHIDTSALNRAAEATEADIFVTVLPGTFVYPHTPVAWLAKDLVQDDAEERRASIAKAFSIGDERNFDQDPRFGLAVMSEIASRALSSSINDSGTAIDVIGRMTRLLSLWANADLQERDDEKEEKIRYPRVHVPALKTSDLFEDAFMVIGRDGAGLIEVQLRLQKSLAALSKMGDAHFAEAAIRQADLALERAEKALPLEADKIRLREECAAIGLSPP